MRPKKSLLATAVIALAAVMCVSAQDSRPRFEVASVKPYLESSSGPMDFSGFQVQPGGRFRVAGVNLKALITYAYGLRDDQIIGGPDWTSSDLWEIRAKAAQGIVPVVTKSFDPAVPDTMAQMVQALIEKRFHLKLRRERIALPTYELVVSNGGPKLQPSDDQTPPIPRQPVNVTVGPRRQGGGPLTPPRGTLMFTTRSSSLRISMLQGKAVTLSYLAGSLAAQLRRGVVDKTNLKGLYDFTLHWMPDPVMLGTASSSTQGTGSSEPSIFTALQEQLGLKLESTRGPVEVLVIDRSEGFSDESRATTGFYQRLPHGASGIVPSAFNSHLV